MRKYKEILDLYDFCTSQGLDVSLRSLFDGFVIKFPNGSDFVQHGGSYGSDYGCVEPAIGSEKDYTAVTLNEAKDLVIEFYDSLCHNKQCKRNNTQ